MHDVVASFSRREFLLRCMAGGSAAFLAFSPRNGFGPVGANDRLRVGVIGLGVAGIENLKTFLRLPNIQVAALCDLSESKLRSASALVRASRQSAPFLASDHRFLADLADLDAVSIAVPVGHRHDIAVDYCDAGKEVVIERPFSSTAAAGKRLVNEAKAGGRIVQQKDDSLPFASGVDLSPFALAAIGPIRGMSGRRSFGSATAEISLAELPEKAWAELDLARCVLGGDIPWAVSVRRSANVGEGHHRAVIDAEYEIESNGVTIEFELETGGAAATSDLRFIGSSGNLTVSTDPASEEAARMASLANFASCVRDRTPDMLANPVSEARKSNLLVELVRTSIEERRGLRVDRQTEYASEVMLR